MPTYVTSASTEAAVNAAVDDNADYDLENSVVKAKQFIVACRVWLARHPTEAADGNNFRFRQESPRIEAMLAKAEAWLARNDTTATTRAKGRVRYLDISEGFR